MGEVEEASDSDTVRTLQECYLTIIDSVFQRTQHSQIHDC
jgi:hypothetical protein